MKKLLLFISIVLLSFGLWAQREPQTSQYLLHPALVNPAAITLRSGMNGALLFQSQWTGYEDAPRTLYLNFNMPLKIRDHFVGGMIISDNVGIHSRNKVMGLYAHKFRLTRTSYFSLGVNPGIDIIQSDYSRAKTDFENDPIMSTSSQSIISFNTGFGAHYYNNRIWVGFSIPELFYNRSIGSGDGQGLSFNPKEWTYQVVAGWKKDIGKYFTAKPSFMTRYSPSAPIQFDLNFMMEYKEQIGLGVSYRTMNSINVLANYRVGKDFKIGYAFNTQLGAEIAQYNAGTHEIALIYGVGNNRKANINLHKKIKRYRKKKLKEVKKALKESEKKRKQQENEKQKKSNENDQPYS